MSEIKPALTPEQWKNGDLDDIGIVGIELKGQLDRHALAAVMLYGTQFGFSWADVDLLRMFGNGDPQEHIREECNALADRIAALLPPRQP